MVCQVLHACAYIAAYMHEHISIAIKHEHIAIAISICIAM